MYPYKVYESDWKLFRQKLPDWQEGYMAKLNADYIALLSGPGAASDKFWALEKRIREDKRDTGVIAEVRRSMMEVNIMHLLSEGAITLADLDGFSEELRERMTWLANRDSADPEADGR